MKIKVNERKFITALCGNLWETKARIKRKKSDFFPKKGGKKRRIEKEEISAIHMSWGRHLVYANANMNANTMYGTSMLFNSVLWLCAVIFFFGKANSTFDVWLHLQKHQLDKHTEGLTLTFENGSAQTVHNTKLDWNTASTASKSSKYTVHMIRLSI